MVFDDHNSLQHAATDVNDNEYNQTTGFRNLILQDLKQFISEPQIT